MVEVIGSSPTAPTNKATAALFKCGGHFIRAGRTAAQPRSSMRRQPYYCRGTPACGKRQSLYRPTIAALFECGGRFIRAGRTAARPRSSIWLCQNLKTSRQKIQDDSSIGLATNAPFRSDFKVDLFIRVRQVI